MAQEQKTEMTKINNEKEDLTQLDRNEDYKNYYENLYANKLNNLDELDKFLKTHYPNRLQNKWKIRVDL